MNRYEFMDRTRELAENMEFLEKQNTHYNAKLSIVLTEIRLVGMTEESNAEYKYYAACIKRNAGLYLDWAGQFDGLLEQYDETGQTVVNLSKQEGKTGE